MAVKKIVGKLTAKDIVRQKQILKESYQSLIKLSDHFFPRHKLDKDQKPIPAAQIHGEFEELLRGTVGFNKAKPYNLLAILPRGCAKSTYANVFFVIWLLLFSKKQYIVLVGATDASIKVHFETLKYEIANNPLLHAFGIQPLPGGSDNKTTFDLETKPQKGMSYLTGKREVRIEAYGANSLPRGLKKNEIRPDMFIIDDLEVKGTGTKPGVENKKYREDIRTIFDGIIVPSGGMAGSMQIVMVGTIMNEAMLLYRLHMDALEGNAFPEFKTIKYSLIENYGTEKAYSIWPERLDVPDFEKMLATARKNGTQNIIYNEYLSQPTSPDDVIFKKENFKYFDARGGVIEICDDDGKPDTLYNRIKLKDCKIVVTADTALTVNERSDETAICIVAVDKDDNKYVLDIIHDKMKAPEAVDKFKEVIRVYNPVAVGIESAAGGIAIIDMLEKELRGNNFCGVTPLKTSGMKKQDRIINKLQMPYANGTIFHNINGDFLDELEYQILSVTRDNIKSPHDDLVDALSYVYDISEYGAAFAANHDESSFYEVMNGGYETESTFSSSYFF